MKFVSKFAGVARPRTDVFNYIFEARRSYPKDRVMYREDKSGTTLTLEELECKSRQLATVLVEQFGVKSGQPVAILAGDSINYPIAYMAILAAGAIVQLIPIQAETATHDVVTRLQATGAQVLITNSPLAKMAHEAAEAAGDIAIYDPENDDRVFSSDTPQYHGFSITNNTDAESSIGFFNRTSGSTGGKMKTVITTHAHFIAVMQATLHTVPQNTDPDNDVWLSTLSFGFFINAKLNIGLNLLLGIPVVIMDEPFAAKNFDIIQRHRITFLFVPPPVASSIASMSMDQAQTVDVSSMKWLLSAGCAMSENVSKSVSKRVNNIHLDLEWGTTETLLIALQMDGHKSPPKSAGRLVHGVEAMVIDVHTGMPVGAGVDGEIYVRNSAASFKGYVNNKTANQEAFDKAGWFHSGDLGSIDENNNVFIKDRMKELIRVGSGYGVHISAVELEQVIFEHPAVREVVVTGVPNPEVGREYPTAFVILSSEWCDKKEEALKSLEHYAGENLVGLQSLTGGFILLDRYPNIGFKIHRRALKEIAQAERQKNTTMTSMASEWRVSSDPVSVNAGYGLLPV